MEEQNLYMLHILNWQSCINMYNNNNNNNNNSVVLKYRVGVQREKPCHMARLGSLALDGSLPRDGVLIKTLVVVTLHHYKPLMSEKVIE